METEIMNSKQVHIPEFDVNTHFWLLRAEGGKYFEDFIDDSYVGIRYNNVHVDDVLNIKGIQSVETIRDIFKEKSNDPDTSKQSLTGRSNMTYHFVFGMHIGDVVLVPSKRSSHFAIGCITSDAFDEDTDYIKERIKNAPINGKDFAISNYIKRRSVKWISTIRREELPSTLVWVLNAHQALFNIDDKQHLTEFMGLISPIFIYSNNIYVRIYANHGGNLTLGDWATIFPKDDSILQTVQMTADIHSPGFFTFIANIANLKTLSIFIDKLWGFGNSHPFVILILFGGTDFLKQGLVKWCQDRYSEHLDISLKREQLKAIKNSPADKLGLEIKTSGNAISNESPNISNTDEKNHHTEEK